MVKIGIVDTMFSRVNMGEIAIDELKEKFPDVEFIRRTVPGVKDLPVECKKLLTGPIEQSSMVHGTKHRSIGNRKLETAHNPKPKTEDSVCDSCIALGMVGGAPVDQVCAHEASMGIQQVKLLTNKHIIEVFVHENEAWSGKEFFEIADNRIRKHVQNVVWLVTDPEKLVGNAGKGIRQGKEDEGSVDKEDKTIGLALVVSEFNDEITEGMKEKALETINKTQNTEHRTTVHVAGVFEMPLVVKKLLADKSVDAVVTLGAVIKGETAHDEVIVKNVAAKLSELSLEFNKPVTLGIIGHDAEYDSAEERAGEYAERAVKAAVNLVKVLRK
jgi:6,7-dimethyl-8-ribityllumazine synthase/riboflavin synthase